jgi:starvation-inducible outer membrane lipoprotein
MLRPLMIALLSLSLAGCSCGPTSLEDEDPTDPNSQTALRTVCWNTAATAIAATAIVAIAARSGGGGGGGGGVYVPPP